MSLIVTNLLIDILGEEFLLWIGARQGTGNRMSTRSYGNLVLRETNKVSHCFKKILRLKILDTVRNFIVYEEVTKRHLWTSYCL